MGLGRGSGRTLGCRSYRPYRLFRLSPTAGRASELPLTLSVQSAGGLRRSIALEWDPRAVAEVDAGSSSASRRVDRGGPGVPRAGGQSPAVGHGWAREEGVSDVQRQAPRPCDGRQAHPRVPAQGPALGGSPAHGDRPGQRRHPALWVLEAGQNTGGGAGYAVSDVGDVNGDGYDDFVVGARDHPQHQRQLRT